MKKVWIKVLVLVVLFLVAVTLFEVIFASGKKDLTTTMADPTLPTITLKYKERSLNLLKGYTVEMDENYIRNTITPVEVGADLEIEIISHEVEVTKLHYEVRSMDGSRLIIDGDLGKKDLSGEAISAKIKMPEILQENEEYLLRITLTAGDQEVNYYTRIMDDTNCDISESIDFAKLFHTETLDESKVSDLKKYMETDSTGDNSSLAYVDIHSTMDQLAWSNFKGTVIDSPLVSVEEMTPDYCVIVLNYVMTSKESDGVTLYYNVEEDYRIKFTESRTYLLDYTRTMDELFRGENSEFTSKKLNLGIRNGEVEYKCNENGKNVSFVQEGELWSYSVESGELARVFSFREFEGVETRQNRDDFQIKVLRVNEAGSTDFVVFGYMNRGIHEGKTGVALYHYDSVANTIEEELWIPTDRSYAVMEEELGGVLYVNNHGIFYMAMEGTIYAIDLSDMSTEILASGVGKSWYQSSDSGKRIAWVNTGESNHCTVMTVMDLDTGQIDKVEANDGEYLRPLGFIDDDLIYGRAKVDQALTDEVGNISYPMYQVELLSDEDQVIKTYSKEGYFTTGITIKDYTIYLSRITIEDGRAKSAEMDTIMNITGDAIFPVMVSSIVSDVRETQIQLKFDEGKNQSNIKVLTPKLLLTDKEVEVILDLPVNDQEYYVYKNGRVILSTEDVSDAIKLASEQEGIVVDYHSAYVWTGSKEAYVDTPSNCKVEDSLLSDDMVERCLSVMVGTQGLTSQIKELLEAGNTPKEVIEEAMPKVRALDLTGCTSEEVLYYVSRGTCVYAMTSSYKPVLIVGYGATTYTIYYPESNSTKSVNRDQMMNDFELAGNVFLTYLNK